MGEVGFRRWLWSGSGSVLDGVWILHSWRWMMGVRLF